MKIVAEPVPLAEWKTMAASRFGNVIKAVVDVERGIMAVDGELHADEEALLLENGSRQDNLWGINIYPDLQGSDRVEFDSIINLRPSRGNPSRSVENEQIRMRILRIVEELIR